MVCYEENNRQNDTEVGTRFIDFTQGCVVIVAYTATVVVGSEKGGKII